MQNILFRSFAFCALLLMFNTAAGFCSSVKRVNAVKSSIKAMDATDHHVPSLNDDVNQISRADTRQVLKLYPTLHCVATVLPIWSFGTKLPTHLLTDKYPLPFKTLFPEHEFS